MVIMTLNLLFDIVSKSAEELEKVGISVKVVNVSTVKPLDEKTIKEAAVGCKVVVTAEEHTIIGGLGSAIAEALRLETNLPIEFVGVKDCFGTSTYDYDELMEFYGLTSKAISDAVLKLVQK